MLTYAGARGLEAVGWSAIFNEIFGYKYYRGKVYNYKRNYFEKISSESVDSFYDIIQILGRQPLMIKNKKSSRKITIPIIVCGDKNKIRSDEPPTP